MTAPGAFIAGRYRLVKRIAAGGMGSVWEARDELLQRRVAVKQLLPQPGLSAADAAVARDRVIREARITARLHHPNAVTLYDVVEDSGNPCLIMQYVPSHSLSSLLLERSTLAPKLVARIGAEVALALTAAHEVGIVHRDVKPSNVLIAEDGSAKLTDFGISHAAGDVNLTSTGMVSGTPAYLAPEVARGASSGFPADVFSLGATLYTALEGSPPFGTDQNSMALLHLVASGHSIPPRRSGSLSPLLVRMLAPEARDRPAMREVVTELRALESEAAVGGTPPPPAQPVLIPVERLSAAHSPPKGERRPFGALLVGATAVIAAVAILIAFLILGRNRAGQNQGLQTTSVAGSPTPDQSASVDRSAKLGDIPAPTKQSRPAQRTQATNRAAQLKPTRSSVASSVPTTVPRQTAPSAAGKAAPATSVQRSTSQPTSAQPTTSQPTTSPLTTSPSTTSQPTPSQPTPSRPATTSFRRTTSVQLTTAARNAAPGTTKQQSSSLSGAGGLAAAVTDYYALMPRDTEDGWTRLTTNFQSDIAKNRQSYQNFWDSIDRVDVSDAQGEPPATVLATVTYYFSDGRVSTERTSYTLVREDGILKIDHSEVVAGQ